jgi:predicted nucleotidyltransferase
MVENPEIIGKILTRLNERVKELDCIYSVEELLRDKEREKALVFLDILKVIPQGWQYPTICEARIRFEGKDYIQADFRESEWVQSADIIIDNNIVGKIEVFYTQFIREINGSQFLPEEQKLLNTIAERLSSFIFSRRLRHTLYYLKTQKEEPSNAEELKDFLPLSSDEHWKWRLRMAQVMADTLDFARYAVKGVYVIGSTKNAVAGPASDIDLIMHFFGTAQQRLELIAWAEGWGQALAEINFSRTGHKCNSLIDLHLITDADIAAKNSYAVMIGRLTDGARVLRQSV